MEPIQYVQIGIVLSSLASGFACSSPTESGQLEREKVGYQIVFMRLESTDSLGLLAAIDPDEGIISPLPVEPGVFDDLRRSPDGRKVLFTRSHGSEPSGTYVMDVNGFDVMALPEVGVGYVWSPDGEKIASLIPVFNEGPGPPTRFIRITDAAGANHIDFPHTGADYPRPTWSPEGNRLVYSENIRFDGKQPDMFRVDVNNHMTVNITNNSDYEWEVAWSPKDSLIAFFAVRGPSSGLYIMHPDGSDVRLLYPGVAVLGFQWAPDGRHLLFTAPGARERERSIVVMEADGGSPTLLATGTLDGLSPSWSPDGEWITYAAMGPSGEYDVYVIKSDGTDLRNLTLGNTNGRSPEWIQIP